MADPTADKPVRRRRLGDLRLVWERVLAYPRQLAIALFALLTTSTATIAIPYGFKRVIDRGFGGGSVDSVDSSFHYLLMIVVVLAIATAIRFYYVSWLGERVVADIRARVQRHLLGLTPRFFEENRPIGNRLAADLRHRVDRDCRRNDRLGGVAQLLHRGRRADLSVRDLAEAGGHVAARHPAPDPADRGAGAAYPQSVAYLAGPRSPTSAASPPRRWAR